MSAKESQPNILLVFADQMRSGMTGVEGNHHVPTPAIDQLAREGVWVRQCIANSPVCGPCRGTMFTGTYPLRHGVISNDLAVRTDLPTLGTVARDAGYRTGYVGKWHLDGVPRSKFTPPGPRRLGFDDFWAAYNCSHSYFDAKYYRDTPELIRRDGYEPVVQTDLAIKFLEQSAGDDKPFCLVVSWGPPHDPYRELPEEYRAMVDPATVRLPGNVMHRDNPLARPLEIRRTFADYYGAIAALDAQLHRLLETLDRLGQAENTLVVFTSDHGDMLWSHGWMKKQSPYEESIHVPMFIRGPGIGGGTQSNRLLSMVDLMPTLLGLAGLNVPASCQGRDLSGTLRSAARDGGNASDDDAVLIMNQFSHDEATAQQMPEWRGVRTNRYTYVEQAGRAPWLLFDNQADPEQMRNLIGEASHEKVRDDLARRLRALLEQTGDPFVSGEELLSRAGLAETWAYRTAHMYD